ncbi:MAG: hypothetical protein IKH46_03885 [Lachnospiraceae bacterium]|nr:hypothetical protein [Lachnospiraceae bacterium]
MSAQSGEKKYVALIPAYKLQFDADEQACVERYFQVLTGDIVFTVPQSLDVSWYEEHFPKGTFRRFPNKFFQGIRGYNKLLLSEDFYTAFEDYKYLLIAQPDAVVWQNRDRIPEFIAKGYDYYGAPWQPARRIWEWTCPKAGKFPFFRIRCCKKNGDGIVMGNGGFSLRHVEHCRALIHEFRWRKIYWFWKRNEDIFFGVFGRDSRRGFKPADIETGRAFALEYHLREAVEKGEIPFAVHGWSKDFKDYVEMQEFLKKHGIDI